MIPLSEIEKAKEKLRDYLTPTPLEKSPELGVQVWLKLENLNLTRSYKIRGALNAILSLDSEARQRGIVAASSGNHAQGIAYGAHLTGVPATIFMPAHTPIRKVRGAQRYGATVRLEQPNFDAAEAAAHQLERETGCVYISPYNDARVVAGAGTIGLELIDQLPQLERVIVCVSGGGLISGIASAVKAHKPHAEIIGVNALHAPAMYNTFYGAHHPEIETTLAEALSGGIEPGSITLEIVRQRVDQLVLVDETQIAAAMRWMIEQHGYLVEGGGAVGIAAALHGVIPLDERPTAIIISGGNVDLATLKAIL